MRTSGKKIAVFDIDGTIFRSSLIIELVDILINEGLFPQRARRTYEKPYRRWLDRKGSYEEYIQALVRCYVRHIKGVRQPKLWRAAEKVMAYQKNRVYRFTRDLVHDLNRKKYVLVAISNSPTDIVQPFAFRFGFDTVYGRIYAVDGRERFTGKILYEDLISDKAKILQRVCAKYRLTLRHSIGVGDTEADISFLRLVDHPIAFNPNKKLYDVAKKRGWKVVVERKDVVYKV